jgi:hypothetical protein
MNANIPFNLPQKPTKLLVGLLFAVLLLAPLAGQNASVVPLSSHLYDLIDSYATLTGVTLSSTVRPWTVQQARRFLRQISDQDQADRAQSIRQEIEQILAQFDEPPKELPLRFNGFISLEAYGRTNNDIDYTYGYGQRQPLFNIATGIYLGHSLALEAEFDLRQEPVSLQNSNNLSNLIFDFSYYDVQLPHRSFGSLVGENWAVMIGRDKLEVGVGNNSRLIISDTPHYIDRLQASLFWDAFTYTFILAHFEPWLTGDESSPVEDNPFWEHIQGGATPATAEPSKYLGLHRFEFRPWHWLLVSLTEGLMFGGKYPDIRLFNPLMIFHSFYEWEHSASLFSAEAQISPLPGLSLYGQYMFNQIQSAYEIERFGADAIPNARGWRAGIQTNHLLGPGILRNTFEYNHTDPYLYIRETPLITYSWRRRVLSNVAGRTLLTLPLGFVHGPDTMSLWFQTQYQIPGLLQARLEVEWINRGEIRITDPYDEGPIPAAKTTPTGASTQTWQTGIHVTGNPLRFLTTAGGLIYTNQSGAQTGNSWEWYVTTTVRALELVQSLR